MIVWPNRQCHWFSEAWKHHLHHAQIRLRRVPQMHPTIPHHKSITRAANRRCPMQASHRGKVRSFSCEESQLRCGSTFEGDVRGSPELVWQQVQGWTGLGNDGVSLPRMDCLWPPLHSTNPGHVVFFRFG